LVFVSSFFSGAAGAGDVSFIGSPAFVSPAGAAGSAGAAGAGAGGGGGGAGSSFLPQPTNVKVKAKRVIADNDTSFLPILSSPPFPSHLNLCLLSILYRTCGFKIQAQKRPNRLSFPLDSSAAETFCALPPEAHFSIAVVEFLSLLSERSRRNMPKHESVYAFAKGD